MIDLFDLNKYIERFKQLELAGLYTLFFFLPFLKVPKNIGVVLFIFGGLCWRLIDKSVKLRKPDTYEILLGLFVLSAVISTAINWPLPKGINGLKDSFNIAVIGVLIYNNIYSNYQKKLLIWLFITGVIISLCIGYYEFHAGRNPLFEFRNMMVAETSIITGVTLAVVIGILLDSASDFGLKEKMVLLIIGLFLFCCLFLMGNRSGLLGFLCFLSVVFVLNIKNIKLYLSCIFIGLLMFVIFINADGKTRGRIHHLFSTEISISNFNKFTPNDQFRFRYWKLSLAQFEFGDKKIFGIGPRNYYSISVDKLHEKSNIFQMENFKKPHAHNMYLTKLCEEGLFGLITMLFISGFVIKNIYTYKKEGNQVNWLFIANFGAVMIPFIAGFFYAPYRREVAWVSILFLSLFLNMCKGNRSLPSPEKWVQKQIDIF